MTMILVLVESEMQCANCIVFHLSLRLILEKHEINFTFEVQRVFFGTSPLIINGIVCFFKFILNVTRGPKGPEPLT